MNQDLMDQAQRRRCIAADARPLSQRGFTIVELMISVVLSLMFITGAVAYLASSNSMKDIQIASSRVQENARFALDELSASIRMAGYYDVLAPMNDIPSGQFFTGECGKFSRCTEDGSESDRIAVLLNPPENDGSDSDCAGNPISSDPQTAISSVVAHLYRVEKVDGVNTLVCDSFLIDLNNKATPINADPYELVAGIDSMQIVYGKTDIQFAGQRNTQLERYVSATDIMEMTPPAGLDTAWVDITSVRVGLLTGSGHADKAARSRNNHYQVLDGYPIRFNDRNFRKVFTSTIQINNARL